MSNRVLKTNCWVLIRELSRDVATTKQWLLSKVQRGHPEAPGEFSSCGQFETFGVTAWEDTACSVRAMCNFDLLAQSGRFI